MRQSNPTQVVRKLSQFWSRVFQLKGKCQVFRRNHHETHVFVFENEIDFDGYLGLLRHKYKFLEDGHEIFKWFCCLEARITILNITLPRFQRALHLLIKTATPVNHDMNLLVLTPHY